LASPASLTPRYSAAAHPDGPLCAETEHASVQVLADSPLTAGPKRNSAVLGPGFRSVAAAGTFTVLLLLDLADPKQKPELGRERLATRLQIRDCGSFADWLTAIVGAETRSWQSG
jgi:hypothetical protein